MADTRAVEPAEAPAPYVPAHWTLTAALLWIATRDLDAATEGDGFNTMLDAVRIASPPTGLAQPERDKHFSIRAGALNRARSQLMTACERGDLVALGVRTTWQPKPAQRGLIDVAGETDSAHQPMPPTDWKLARHMLCDHAGRAELRVRFKGGPGRLGRHVVWREILLPSAELMRMWPPVRRLQETRCRRWLAGKVQRNERITKADATAVAVRSYGVTANRFQEAVWPEIAPDDWKKAGRPRGRKSRGINRRVR